VRWDDGQVERYVVVTPPELDLRSGHISCESPVGQAVLGRRAGEVAKLMSPGGVSSLRLLDVTPPASLRMAGEDVARPQRAVVAAG
jgi:transcription elongation GreA/GreB family factor